MVFIQGKCPLQISQIRIFHYDFIPKLTRFVVRGPRASQCRLYPKPSNQVNLVLYPIKPDL